MRLKQEKKIVYVCVCVCVCVYTHTRAVCIRLRFFYSCVQPDYGLSGRNM